MRLALAAALAGAALACAGGASRPTSRPAPGLPGGLDEGAARASLVRFAEALEAGRIEEAHALLSARWRRAYTPGRLRLDLAGAGAREAIGRALAAVRAGAPLERGEGQARLPLPAGGAAVLVAEEGAWRVDALE